MTDLFAIAIAPLPMIRLFLFSTVRFDASFGALAAAGAFLSDEL